MLTNPVGGNAKRAAAARAVGEKLKPQLGTAPKRPGAGKLGTPATQVPSFTKDPTYLAQKNTNGIELDDYNAQRLLGSQLLGSQVGVQTNALQRQGVDTSNDIADDYAARGVLASGAYLGAQDRAAADTAGQVGALQQQVTDYGLETSAGRLNLQNTNRGKLDSLLAKLQSAFYGQQRKAK